MLRYFTSCSFSHPQELRSTSLKVAIILGLVFLLPVALACQEIERRYKITRYKRSAPGRHDRLVRRIYIFVKLSGISKFSDFLLSASCSKAMNKHYSEQDQSPTLSTVT